MSGNEPVSLDLAPEEFGAAIKVLYNVAGETDAPPEVALRTADADELPVAIRDCGPADLNFIAANWARSTRPLEPFSSWSDEEFRRHMRRMMDWLVSDAAAIAIAACNPEEPTQLYGVLVGGLDGTDRYVLHLLYVRKPWRRQRMASRLLRVAFPRVGELPIFYTQPAKAARYHRERWRLCFHPWLLQWRTPCP